MLLKTLWRALRPPFLLLSISVVVLGAALAVYEGTPLFAWHFFLALLGALSTHGAVNLLNEYEDRRSGLDDLTERTPFSGGSGALQAHPEYAGYVKRMGYLLLGITFLIGLYFYVTVGDGVLWIGGLGVLLVVTYTRFLTRLPGLCLIAPGLAFGPLMVVGTYYVMTGHFSSKALAVSLVPFFLVNNLLLLNQIPDMAADSQVGRRTFPLVVGLPVTLQVFHVFLLSAYGVLLILVAVDWLPSMALWGLATGVLALPMLLHLMRFKAGRETALLPALALNVLINLLMPLLIAAGLMVS